MGPANKLMMGVGVLEIIELRLRMYLGLNIGLVGCKDWLRGGNRPIYY